MTMTDAVIRAGALAAVLLAANRIRKKGTASRPPVKSKSAAAQSVAATAVSAVILLIYLYAMRHYLAALFRH